MSVIIGSARHDEFGTYANANAKPGDQDKTEVSKQPFYLHSKGWVVIRAKRPEIREKIAQCAEWCCDNDLIGYNQLRRDTLYSESRLYGFDVRKIQKAVETDCSAMVRVCVNYAGVKVRDFYTGNAADTLAGTEEFDILKFESEDKLLRGDILCTKTKGHIVVCLNDGDSAKVYPRWIKSGDNWYYRIAEGKNAHGWRFINHHRYYFNNIGVMLTGWQLIDEKWYYFEPTGPLEGALYRSDENGAQSIWEL